MNDYSELLEYYKKCFRLIDCFHFNSRTAQNVYQENLHLKNGRVLPITHSGINDNRHKKLWETKILRIGFIGNTTPYKGLPLLIKVLKKMPDPKIWKLNIWGGKTGKEKNWPIYYRGKFDNRSVATVYGEMDVLIVPSIWKETFSLVTLEALSYGVPVIVSSNVGAKDIVKLYDEKFVFNNFEELKFLLEGLVNSKVLLKKFHKKVLEAEWCYSLNKHAQDIIDRIYKD